eukprot:5111116-Amphidinium_carterae.1
MAGYTCAPPGEFLRLVSGESKVVEEGLACQMRNWEVLIQSESKQFEVQEVRELLKEIGWVQNVAVREVLVALAEHQFRMVPPNVTKLLENMLGGFSSTLVCEKAFQKLRDVRREAQSERIGRLTRFYWPVASQLLQEMGREEVTPSSASAAENGLPRSLPPTVFHCEGLPCSLPDQDMTRMKKEVRGKKEFLSTNARDMMLQTGAWRLLCHVAGAKKWKDLQKTWVNQLFDEQCVYLHTVTGKFWLALKVSRHGVLAWPLLRHMRGELTFYGLSNKAGCQAEWLHAFEASDWEYQPTACMPPSVVKSLSPGAKPFVLPVQTGSPEKMPIHAARRGFINMRDKELRVVIQHYVETDGIAAPTTLRTVIDRVEWLVLYLIPDLQDKHLGEIILKRAGIQKGKTRTSVIMAGDNLELTAGAMEVQDYETAKNYKLDTHVAKVTAKSSAIRHCGVKKYLKPEEVENLLSKFGATPHVVQPRERKSAAKGTWTWTEKNLKQHIPKLAGCTITEERNERYTGWTGRYPNVKPGSRSKAYNETTSSDTAAAHVFGWLWSTHNAETGEQIPHEIAGWERL